MELSALRIFCSVHEFGGITRAAEHLNRVPSNVTTRLKQLESDLGVQLFERSKKRLYLTAEGECLYAYAKQILSLAEQARHAVKEHILQGKLYVGCIESIAATTFPLFLADYHQRHPNVDVMLKTGSSSELIKQLLAGDLEAVWVANPDYYPELEQDIAYSEELVIVSNMTHPLIQQPADLFDSVVLGFGEGCSYQQRFMQWIGSGSQDLPRTMIFSNYHLILSSVMSGLGVALLPLSIVEAYPNQHKLQRHTLSKLWSQSNIMMLLRKGHRSKRLQALQSVAQQIEGVIDVEVRSKRQKIVQKKRE